MTNPDVKPVSRRAFVRLSLLGSAGALLAACAPAAPPAAPQPTQAPAQPTAAPAAPKPTVAAVSPTTAPAAAPKPSPVAKDSQAEWDRTVEAAKREGVVTLAGPPIEGYRTGLLAFQKAYPGITVEYTGISGRDLAPKILAEREAGQFLWDLHISGSATPMLLMKPKGVLDPIKPALILPEVLDDSKWAGGFDSGFIDKDKQIFGFQAFVGPTAHVNRDMVPESELSKIEQLLEPKWKGKITWDEPRRTGYGSGTAALWLMLLGEDFLRRLLQQDIIVTTDLRQQTEFIVRGTHPIGIGIDESNLDTFKKEGVGLNVKRLDPTSEAGQFLLQAWGDVMLVNRAPHPNAAKVYINWLLSKDGQTAWVEASKQNSLRLDVAGPPETAPDPKKKYRYPYQEENFHYVDKAINLAKEILK